MGLSVLFQMLALRVALPTSWHAAFICKILGGGFGWLERQLVDGNVVVIRKLTMMCKYCPGGRYAKELRKYVVDGRWRLDTHTASLR
jgi:hypothetical protein